jgi:hypothetical protein
MTTPLKMKITKFDQKVIDAYEGYIMNVNEAIRFVKMGAGKKMAGNFEILETIIKQHEKEMWQKIEDEMNKTK